MTRGALRLATTVVLLAFDAWATRSLADPLPAVSQSPTAESGSSSNVDLVVSGLDPSPRRTRLLFGHAGRVLALCETTTYACGVQLPPGLASVTIHARGAVHFDLADVPIAWHGDRSRVDLHANIAPVTQAWIALPIALAAAALGSIGVAAVCSSNTCTDGAFVTAGGATLLAMTAGMHMMFSAEQPEVHACADPTGAPCTGSGHVMPASDGTRSAPLVQPSETEHDVEQRDFAPAFSLEGGVGVGVPTLHAPVLHAAARVGVAVHLPPVLSVIVGAESGVDVAATSGTASPTASFVRVPVAFAIEFVERRSLDDFARHTLDFHFGGTVGADVLYAPHCTGGACTAPAANTVFGFSLRVGVTYSARRHHAVGWFVAWHPSVAPCVQGAGVCFPSTLTWNLAWAVF